MGTNKRKRIHLQHRQLFRLNLLEAKMKASELLVAFFFVLFLISAVAGKSL